MSLMSESATGGKLSVRDVDVLEWRPRESNSLQGFATIHVERWGLTIRDVALHKRDGKAWAQLPCKPQVDRDGHPIREDNGKVRYTKLFTFDSREHSDAFNAAVTAAVGRHLAMRNDL